MKLPVNPFVSIIVPNYNHANYLKQRLDSLINQTYNNFEIIILDDLSKDNSLDILESYHDVRIKHKVYNTTNSGSTFKQWKKGLELAKGELIWIAESDDWAEITFLEKMVPIFLKHDNVAIAYSDMLYVDENGENYPETFEDYTTYTHPTYWKNNHYSNGRNYVKKYMINKCMIVNASAVIFRKELGKKYIDDVLSYKQAGDWLFWNLILSEKDYFVYYYGSEKLNYFRHSLQSTRNYPTIEKKESGLIERTNVIFSTLNKLDLSERIKTKKKREILDWWAKDHSLQEVFRSSFSDILNTEMFKKKTKIDLYLHYFKYRIKNIPFIKAIKHA